MMKLYARIKDENARQEKVLRYIFKRSYRGKQAKKTLPLLEEPRIGYKDENDWETAYEYGFLSHRTDLTDEEIQELKDGMRLVICSPYDCTGKWFTRYIATHRNPSGLVSYVHCMGLDV